MRSACLVVWTAASVVAACVPRGDPPQGRQIIADRISVPVYVVPSTGDGITRVLVTRPGETPDSSDLYEISVDAAGGAPVEQLLVPQLLSGCFSSTANCFPADARGRLLVHTGERQPYAESTNLARVDPVTGERTDLGLASSYSLSASGQQLLIRSSFTDGVQTLYDANDRAMLLDTGPGAPSFIGEVLYYVDSQQQVVRLAPGGSPEVLATGVMYAWPQSGSGNQTLWLERTSDHTPMTGGPATTMYSLLDLATLQELPCPTLNFCEVSFDGRWLATATDKHTIVLTDRRTGATEQFATPGDQFFAQWRPGHNQLWVGTTTFSQEARPSLNETWVKEPGVDPVKIPGPALQDFLYWNSWIGDYFSGGFTNDGAVWASLTVHPDDQYVAEVGPADDPTGPRFAVAQPNTHSDTYWVLADGRILTPAWATTNDRANMYVVDPITGDSRVMGEDGVLLAVGRTRLLVNQHHIQNTGDLTVFDLATGQGTVLAPEFALTAATEKRGADFIAPGTSIAYQFTARFPSPYDGVWLTEVP